MQGQRTDAPRISVLIGCWNNSATLARAIESILAQTIEDLELIVVDDGSTDHTPELVNSIQDARVRYLPLAHMGISRSLNQGIGAASAPVVAVQDADDYSLPNRLERQLDALDSLSRVAVVGARMREVDEGGAELTPRTSFATGNVDRALMRFNPLPNSCAAFRRDAVLEMGGYDPRYRYAMDYDLWLRIAERHPVFMLDEVLAVRQMGTTNIAATRERAQTREAILIRWRALCRRRSPRGAGGLALPTISYLTPLAAKRALRRARGQL